MAASLRLHRGGMYELVTIWKGEDFFLSFECRDADGQLVNFTGAEVWSHVRVKPEAPLTADLMPWADPENAGMIQIAVPADMTNAWPAGDYKFDVVVKLASGAYASVLPTTPIQIRQRITQPPHPL